MALYPWFIKLFGNILLENFLGVSKVYQQLDCAQARIGMHDISVL